MSRPGRCRHRKIDRRLRPVLATGVVEGVVPLEPRLLLSASIEHAGSTAQITDLARRAPHHAKAAHPPKRLTPAQEINAQYAIFTAGFAKTLNDYVNSINEESTSDVSVQATVTATYTPPAAVIQVDDASVFGPEGVFSPQVTANALVGTVSLGQFTLSGSSGNLLIVNTTQSPSVELAGRHRAHSQCSHDGAKQRGIDLSQLYHGQHDPDGHQPGAVLQQDPDQAPARERATAYSRTARRDPDLRVRQHRRHEGDEPLPVYERQLAAEPATVAAGNPVAHNRRLRFADLQSVGHERDRRVTSAAQ